MRQLNQIILAMLAMSGRVTMLGISRWAGIGSSYRTMPLVFSYGNTLGYVVLAIFPQAFIPCELSWFSICS